MSVQKITPKLFAGLACIGVGTTAYLAAKASPEAKKAIEESGATTRKEKFAVGIKYYIPTIASGVITIAAIIANHSTLVRENTKLALAYGFGQTAVRLYSEKVSPQVRQEINQQAFEKVQQETDTVLVDPSTISDDAKMKFKDYLSNRECYMSRNQIKTALQEFEDLYLKTEGKGSLNQLYSCFHGTAIEMPIGYFGETHGWKYVNNQGPIPIISSGFDEQGILCAVLDYANPPQSDYNNEFA